MCVCVYVKILKKKQPLIYINIYIYGVHCGKVLILENIPGRIKSINM